MEPGLKQRLVGAAALAALAVVFLPMVFDDTGVSEDVSGARWIPPRPPDSPGPVAPLTEPEIKRGARLPPLPIDSTPDDPALTGDTGGRAKPPAADTTAPAATPPATFAPGAETRRSPRRPRAPATGPADADRKTAGANRVGTTWAIQLGSFGSEATPRSYAIAYRSSAFSPSWSASP